ncbi:metallophosphoesterase, partial [bacterium]|nr:metallophosphoesterase [bacterium]
MRKSTMVMALAFALVGAIAHGAEAAITKGPYLQNVTRDGITVMFETDQPGTGTVDFGATNSYGQSMSAEYETYIDFSEGLRFIYQIRVDGLAAGSTYHYRARHGLVTTGDKTFVTAPTHLDSFNFVIFGDSRGGSIANPNTQHEAAIAAIAAANPMFFANTGDFVASGAQKADWDYHFHVESDLMATAPLYPVFGNHEEDEDDVTGLTGDQLWAFYFDTPDDDDLTWYSFDYGNIHFIVIDVNKSWQMVPGAPEYQWLVADLAADAANKKTNFTIAMFHQPAFTWKDGRTPDIVSRFVVEPLLRAADVDIVVAGHDHFYARCWLNGIMHTVTGGGGASLYDFYPNVQNRPGYIAHAQDHHFFNIEATPLTLSFEVISVTTGALIDSWVLDAKEPPEGFGDDDDDDAADDDAADDDAADDDAADDDAADDDAADDDAADDDAADDDADDDDADDDDAVDDDAADDDMTDDDADDDD